MSDKQDMVITAQDGVNRLIQVLKWYGEQARLARLIHSGGDAGRHALAEDGGQNANDAVEAYFAITALSTQPSVADEVQKLQAFKDYVHKRLDEAGIPTHPDGAHSKEGCRVGDRLDIALSVADEVKVLREALKPFATKGQTALSSVPDERELAIVYAEYAPNGSVGKITAGELRATRKGLQR